MKKFKVTLTGSSTHYVKANDANEAYVIAFEEAEGIMMHDFIDDGNVEEVKDETENK